MPVASSQLLLDGGRLSIAGEWNVLGGTNQESTDAAEGPCPRLEDEDQGDSTGLGTIRPEISGPERLSAALPVFVLTQSLLATWGGSSPAKGTS